MESSLLANLGQAVPIIAETGGEEETVVNVVGEPIEEPILATAEAIGLGGGALMILLGVFTKQSVMTGVGSSLAATGLFSAIVRHSRNREPVL